MLINAKSIRETTSATEVATEKLELIDLPAGTL
jgi:hypothetical protein